MSLPLPTPLPSRARGPVAKYYLYRASQSAAFTVPIFVLFFRSRGLSFAGIGLVEAVYTLVVLGAEVPTGYVGDRFGRRASMLAGTVLTAAGAAAFVLARSLPAFALVVALRGVAATLQSGSREAWLYETLAERADADATRDGGAGATGDGGADATRDGDADATGDDDADATGDGDADATRDGGASATGDGGADAFARVSGRAGALSRATHAGAALSGSALYAVDPRLPWLVEAAAVGTGALVLLSVPDSPRDAGRTVAGDGGDAPDGESSSPVQSVRGTLAVARRTLSNRALGAFVVYAGLLFGLLNTLEIYVQPVSVGVAGVAPAHLGLLYAGFTLLAAAAAAGAGRVRETVGVAGWFGAAPLGLAALLVAVAVAPAVAVPAPALPRALSALGRPSLVPALALSAFVAARAVGAVSRPLADQYLNDHAGDAARATVLSGAGMVRSLLVAPLNVVGGALAGALALTTAMGALGGILAAGAVAVLLVRFPVVEAEAKAGG